MKRRGFIGAGLAAIAAAFGAAKGDEENKASLGWVMEQIHELSLRLSKRHWSDGCGFTSHPGGWILASIGTVDWSYTIYIRHDSLGGIVENHHPVYGKNSLRDLPDGKRTVETWNRIAKQIEEIEAAESRGHQPPEFTTSGRDNSGKVTVI